MTIYTVVKIDSQTGKEINYGKCCLNDVKAITKGYTFNGLFYDRKGSKYMFIVTEITE